MKCRYIRIATKKMFSQIGACTSTLWPFLCIFAFNSTIYAIKECSNQINPQNKKGSYTSYLHFIEKAQQNPSKRSCATAVFVCFNIKKMWIHGHLSYSGVLESNKPSKQKGQKTCYLHFIEKAQQNPSKHSCATAVFVCGHKKNVHERPFKILRSALIK